MSMSELIEDIFEELKIDLEIELDTIDETQLRLKIKNAYREVQYKMNYPKAYTQEQIEDDMYKNRPVIYNVASYDYIHIGGDWQKSVTESGENRSYIDRDSLFKIIPFAKK